MTGRSALGWVAAGTRGPCCDTCPWGTALGRWAPLGAARWAPSACCSTIHYRSIGPSFITEADRGLAGNNAALLASSGPAAPGDMSLLEQKVHPSELPAAYLLSLCELPARQSRAGAGDSPQPGH